MAQDCEGVSGAGSHGSGTVTGGIPVVSAEEAELFEGSGRVQGTVCSPDPGTGATS